MSFLDILEIIVSTYLHLSASGLITNDNAFWMQLQSRNGPHLVNSALNRLLQSTRLVMTIHHDQHLLGIQYQHQP